MQRDVVLSPEHILDSPASVIVWETNTEMRNVTGTSNGVLKEMFPGFYREPTKHKWKSNLKVGSVLVLRTSPELENPLIVAMTAVHSPAFTHFRWSQLEECVRMVFRWFWTQYLDDNRVADSLGMYLMGYDRIGKGSTPRLLDLHFKLWEAEKTTARTKAGMLESPTLYIHALEGKHISPIRRQAWDGQVMKVCLWNPANPRFEK